MTDKSIDGAKASEDDLCPVAGPVKNQTIVDTSKAPRLTGVTFLDFIKFNKARDNYEREVAEKIVNLVLIYKYLPS